MLIRRSRITQEIREALKAHPGVVLLGPRQVGKSTLARELAKTARGETHFFDLENPQDALLLENPRLALEDLEGLDGGANKEISNLG